MKRCYHCGTENDDSLATCRECAGKLLASTRPKARLFGLLASLWAPLALIGILLLWLDTWGTEFMGIRRLVWLVVLSEAVLLGLAVLFQFVERPRKVPAPSHWDRPIID